MASALDMTLDDIIKTNKKKPSSNGGGAGPKRRDRPAAAAGGPARRNFKRAGKRAPPISKVYLQFSPMRSLQITVLDSSFTARSLVVDQICWMI